MAKSLLFHGVTALGCWFALAAASPAPAAAGGVYFAKEGDTLPGISALFGVEVQRLREANHLADAAVKPGDKLRIPDRPVVTPRVAADARSRDAAAERVARAICREETVYHTVAAGDTLFAIARRYDTSVDGLLQLNSLRKRARLSIGQKILVRRTGPRSHTVHRGETLHRIALRYRLPVSELARLNHLDGETIVAGQRLQIEPCDPYAAAGSAPPPLGGPASAELQAAGRMAVLPPSPASAPPAVLGSAVPAPVPTVTDRVITLARTMLNVPYRFGGTTLRGIDCSAYVQRVFGLLDVQLPRTAREQYSIGAEIDRDELAVGDLVFFRTYASFPSHVGIYIGDDLFIHASSMVRKVAIDSLDLPYYRKRFLGARRLVTDDTPSLASAP
jgi:peptidoglycan endopeptidase LytE